MLCKKHHVEEADCSCPQWSSEAQARMATRARRAAAEEVWRVTRGPGVSSFWVRGYIACLVAFVIVLLATFDSGRVSLLCLVPTLGALGCLSVASLSNHSAQRR
jgi:hypothetical protein